MFAFSPFQMLIGFDSTAAHCVLAPLPSAIQFNKESILLTSAIRLMFSFRSFSENPKSLFSPKRTLSPSNRYAASPRCRRCCSSAVAMVDLPEAESPVNQIVKPRCLRFALRSLRERDGCQVMLLFAKCELLREDGGVWWGRTYVAIVVDWEDVLGLKMVVEMGERVKEEVECGKGIIDVVGSVCPVKFFNTDFATLALGSFISVNDVLRAGGSVHWFSFPYHRAAKIGESLNAP
jgi:hypothetical protein